MRSRRVPVLKLGSRGPGGDARSLRCVRKAFASVRKRLQAFASVRKAFAKRSRRVGHAERRTRRKSSRNAELSSLFTFRITKVSAVTGIGGVVVAKPRTVVTFGLASGLRVSRVSTVTGIGGVVVAKRRTVATFGLASGLRVSKVSTVTGIGGVVVAKRRTVVTFGLASGLRVSKVSTITGIGGSRGCETQNCRHFWTRLGSSRLKSVNSHRDRGGSWSRNAELSPLLDSPRVFASRERREQGREERREEGGERRGERREERGERREERGERRGERREERREKREEKRERSRKREEKRERRERRKERGGEREMRNERGEKREEEKEEKGMTPDLSLLSSFACGVLLSLHVRDTCLHSGSWLLSGSFA